jgi:hypothetical protein
VERFGDRYAFHLADVLPFVLDDQGRMPTEFPKTLAFQILRTFQPEKGSLSTWTTRFVQQHPEMTRFFAEQGLILMSDWALLNDTTPTQLHRILAEVYLLSQPELNRAIALLNAYHTVYSKAPKSCGRCIPPSIVQLREINQRLSQSDAASPNLLLSRLNRLATLIRQYRVRRRQGSIFAGSIDALMIPAPIEEPVCSVETRFLWRYRRALITELDAAIVDALTARMQRFERNRCGLPSSQRFLLALHGLYCEQRTMGAIAVQLGLSGQDRVTKLLQLPALRSQIKAQLIQRLKPRLSPLLPVAEIDHILQEQLESLFTLDAQYLRTPVMFRRPESRGLLTLRMAHCLDRWLKDALTVKKSLPATMAEVEVRSTQSTMSLHQHQSHSSVCYP